MKLQAPELAGFFNATYPSFSHLYNPPYLLDSPAVLSTVWNLDLGTNFQASKFKYVFPRGGRKSKIKEGKEKMERESKVKKISFYKTKLLLEGETKFGFKCVLGGE